jgi:hypothetical protein
MFQYEYGDDASKVRVDGLMPNKVKKRRKIERDDGVSRVWNRVSFAQIILLLMERSCSSVAFE